MTVPVTPSWAFMAEQISGLPEKGRAEIFQPIKESRRRCETDRSRMGGGRDSSHLKGRDYHRSQAGLCSQVEVRVIASYNAAMLFFLVLLM